MSYTSGIEYGGVEALYEDLNYQDGNNFEISAQADSLTYLAFDYL